MRRHLIRIAVVLGLGTGLAGLIETAAYARISANHAEPRH
jgi:hypothetical protein